VLFSDLIITVTEIWRQKLTSRSVASSKCLVLLNVPDSDIFKLLPDDRPRSTDSFNLYYHGSLEEHFGVDTLIQAMPMIREHIPNVALHIYGSGRCRETYQELVRQLGIDEAVTFYNSVPFYRLPQILSSADMGIVPTKNAVFADEALSMKSLEYISLGIPIVISRTTIHQYYYDDDMVMFFNPTDPDDLADKVIGMHGDPGKRKRIVEQSQKFMQQHNWSNYKQEYYRAIEHLLNK